MALSPPQWLDLDPLTFETIIQVQLEDIENLSSRAKGKQREDTVTDAQYALQMYVEDLARSGAVRNDRTVAKDVATALFTDIPAMEEAVRLQKQVARDRELALKLAGSSSMPIKRNSILHKLRRKEADPLKELWPVLLDSDSEESTVAESSSWAASRFVRDIAPKRRCIACIEEKVVGQMVTVPCKYGHEYCRDCIAKLIRNAVEDESQFPPRCDGSEIDVDCYRDFLPPDLVEQFQSKSLELNTKDRTYCHGNECSAFIPPDSIEVLTAICPQCGKTTCTLCKCQSHLGDCPGDETLRQLTETASAQQWQRCYMCNNIVELESGCNHISCRCGTEFCYVCSARWKTCDCPFWKEDRLFDAAVELSEPTRSEPIRRRPKPDQRNSVLYQHPNTNFAPSVELTPTTAVAVRPRKGPRQTMPLPLPPQCHHCRQSDEPKTSPQCVIQ